MQSHVTHLRQVCFNKGRGVEYSSSALHTPPSGCRTLHMRFNALSNKLDRRMLAAADAFKVSQVDMNNIKPRKTVS